MKKVTLLLFSIIIFIGSAFAQNRIIPQKPVGIINIDTKQKSLNQSYIIDFEDFENSTGIWNSSVPKNGSTAKWGVVSNYGAENNYTWLFESDPNGNNSIYVAGSNPEKGITDITPPYDPLYRNNMVTFLQTNKYYKTDSYALNSFNISFNYNSPKVEGADDLKLFIRYDGDNTPIEIWDIDDNGKETNGWVNVKKNVTSRIDSRPFAFYFQFVSGKFNIADGVYLDDIKIEKNQKSEITLDRSNVKFNWDDAPYDVGVTSNVDWKASSNKTWLGVSPKDGSGNGFIELDPSRNSSISSRSAIITVSSGNLSETINVTQDGKPFITQSPEKWTFPALGGEKMFNISTNSSSWSITDSPSWVTITNKTNSSFKATTTQYKNSSSDRTGDIKVFSSDGIEAAISITQEKEQITVSPKSIDFEYNGNYKNFTITSNTEVDIITLDSDWATIREGNGSFNQIYSIIGTKTVYLLPEKNDDVSSRSGRIRLKGQSNNILGEIKFSQEGTGIVVPSPPVLSSPRNAATNQELSLKLDWGNVTGATGYDVQVSTSSSFTSTLKSASVSSSEYTASGLSYSKKYYWRVRAKNSAGSSSWSSVRNFTTKAEPISVPSSPSLTSPSNGATNQELSLKLDWGNVTGATGYDVQVSTSSSFTSTLKSESVSSSEYTASGLSYSKKYYWRARAKNSAGSSSWSSVRNFTTKAEPISVPSSPSLISPSNGATNQELSLKLDWGNVTGATGYDVQVSTSSSFSSTIKSESVSSSEYTASGLSYSKKYYWRARAKNSAGSSSWSSVRNFTTKAEPISVPSSPSLISPSNGATNQELSLKLDWGNVTGSTGYDVQVSTSSSFSSTIKSESVSSSEYTTSGLSYSKKYYWRARAKNSAGSSSWSSVRNFTTKAEPISVPSSPSLISPSNGATNQELSLKLDWGNVTGSTGYDVQVSTNSSFSSIVKSANTSGSSYTLSGLAYETKYYWRVRAKNSVGSSSWTTARNFTTKDKVNPPPPTLSVSPTSLSFTSAGGTKSFAVTSNIDSWSVSDNASWITITGADKSGDDSNISVVVTSNVSTSSRNGTVTVSGGGKSATVSISQSPSILTSPILKSPTNGLDNLKINSLVLDWKDVSGATHYELEVSKSSSFIFGKIIDSDTLTNSNFVLPILENQETYYWRVKALNSDNKSDWSAKWSFTTIEELVLAVPVLISPNDNSTFEPSTPIVFKWYGIDDAMGYEIKFNNETEISTSADTSFRLITDNLGDFDWKVRSVKSLDKSDWSETRSFTISAETEVTSLSANKNQSPNSEFQVDVTVGSESNPVEDLYGMSYVISYDPSILEMIMNSKEDFLGSNVTYLPVDDPTNGEFAVGITKNGSQPGSNGTGIVSSLTFKVNPNISTDTKTIIKLTEIDAENSNQQKIPFSESEIEIAISTGISVWPGDTRNDGLVNQKDVLPIGRYWQKTGPERPNSSSNWEAQLATPWDPEDATYADANGDGVVNQKDVLPIGRNWEKTYSVNTKTLPIVAKIMQNSNPPIALLTNDAVVLNSNFNVKVQLGNSDSALTDVFGSSYVINYDPDFIKYVSDKAENFLGISPVYFAKDDSVVGTVGVGISRTSGSSSGYGDLSTITFKLIKEISEEVETIIYLSEVEVKDVNDEDIPVSLRDLVINKNQTSVSNEEYKELDKSITLHQNYPNPFNPSTNIEFSLPQSSKVDIKVIDITGREVATLISEIKSAGNHSVTFDASNLSSGVYFYQFKAGGFVQTKRMLLIK